MKTPDEIKKGLECCTDICDEGCHICVYNKPYNRRDKQCLVQLKVDALAYIQRLERERDAAVEDLKTLAEYVDRNVVCSVCSHEKEVCGICEFEWRGAEVE